MRRLLCRLRGHPISDDGDIIAECPCGTYGVVSLDDPTAADVLRIRAANETNPTLAAIFTAAADWIEEDA